MANNKKGTFGAYWSLTKNLTLLAEVTETKSSNQAGGDNKANTFNVGAYVVLLRRGAAGDGGIFMATQVRRRSLRTVDAFFGQRLLTAAASLALWLRARTAAAQRRDAGACRRGDLPSDAPGSARRLC